MRQQRNNACELLHVKLIDVAHPEYSLSRSDIQNKIITIPGGTQCSQSVTVRLSDVCNYQTKLKKALSG